MPHKTCPSRRPWTPANSKQPAELHGKGVPGEPIAAYTVGQLYLHPAFEHIETSWAELGLEGFAPCLQAGADGMGGTLMDESIARAAGGAHGQEVTVAEIRALAERLGRTPWQRLTLYASPARCASPPVAAHGCTPLA